MEPNQAEPSESTSPEQAEQAAHVTGLIEQLKREQNLPRGVALGVVAALMGAFIWAAVTVATGYQIGWLAVGVGFMVGYAVRLGGKGLNRTFGYVGAVLAFLGCALGNYLSVVGFVAQDQGWGYMETMGQMGLSAIPSVMSATFQAMDLLFYGIAIYEGYKFSFRQLTAAELGLPTSEEDTAIPEKAP